jgi:hypothetical protein
MVGIDEKFTQVFFTLKGKVYLENLVMDGIATDYELKY